MIEVALMLEGQNGLNWPRWQRIAQAAEDLGFVGLYRSDHYTNANPPDLDSLELWVSLTWLAGHTQRLEFGPIVSPMSFRHPTITARMAAQIDDLAGGRLHLGLGAGWQEREHTNFGLDLLDIAPRFQRFEEGLEVISRLLKSDTPVNYSGSFYRLNEAILLPRPQRPGGPPIVIGGNGPKRTLPLTARYADEWNAVFVAPNRFAELNAQLDALLVAQGREPARVRRSLMTGLAWAPTTDDFERWLRNTGRTREQLAERGVIHGALEEIPAQIQAFAAAGVQRIMIQWLDLDDIAGLEQFAGYVLPQVGR
jgi:F420-dependent oxidoreductase-like protein